MAPEEKASELKRLLEAERIKTQQLEADKKAISQEFAKAGGDYDKTVEVAKKGIANMLELAVTTAETLLANATSESVQASMSKFVIETVISGKLEKAPEGEIRSLIQRLAENDPKFKEEAQEIVDNSSE